jgi:hypothetical protein
MDGMSLLDVLRGVMLDPAEQAAYNADPDAYLQRFGYDDVDPADLSEAFGLVADTLPPDQAQAAWQSAGASDNGTFGAVTADFDSEGGDTAVTTPDAVTESLVPTEPPPDAEPLLSFGQGVAGDAGQAGDAGSSGAAGGFGEPTSTDVAPDTPDEATPDQIPPDDATDDVFAIGDGDAFDAELGSGEDGGPLDEAGLDDSAAADDLDDLEQIDGLDQLGAPGADETDIGSF